MAPCELENKLLNIQFAKYHIWNNKRETFNQSVCKNTVTQYHQCSRAKLTGASGFQIWYLALNIRKLWTRVTRFNPYGFLILDKKINPHFTRQLGAL